MFDSESEMTPNFCGFCLFQAKIKKCIQLFEDCTRLVSICGLFSSNENYAELPTNDLKYLLLPYFLGMLSQKICGGSRADIIEAAEVYFKDFLIRCSDYELHEISTSNAIVKSTDTGATSHDIRVLTQMVTSRNQKLEKYRQRKELEDQIGILKKAMKMEHIEDETKREFYVNLLKLSIIDAQEELASIEQEKQMLQFMKNGPQIEVKNPNKPKCCDKTWRPLRPIIITKDLAQKAVYGLGYPSLPTMTVAEFYDQRVRDGIFPDPDAPKHTSGMNKLSINDTNEIEEAEDIERELKLDADDDYELARLRAKDDYKDEHRRGEGNRHNRS